MSVIGTCPTCGTNAPVETFLIDRDAREAFAALCQRLADHPEVIKRVPAYLALHARPGRSTSWPKVARLVRELADLVASPAVACEGQPRVNLPELWAMAMDEAQDARTAGTLTVPLDGHGWLRKVAWTKAGQQESREAAKRLAQARGETPVGYSAAHAQAGQAPERAANPIAELAAELATLRRLERYNPGCHSEEIANLQRQLAAARGTTATPQDS